ncbi:metal ABC transporter permease [Candidatus Curculioniphilus buchneri]|uniref:metal ABC transporter permease n=1 Tax=Candidatus Curculioniphilus buchneri TaxID=690594 RepID=UPI00376EB0C7
MLIVTYLIEPLRHSFMQRALLVALLIGIVCAVLSCFLVLKGWSLMGDAISHAVLPGIVLACASGLPLSLGAFISSLICAYTIAYIKNHSHLKEDTVMGIIYTGMFGLGLVLFARIDTDQHLSHILFGNILGIPIQEFLHILIISITVTLILLLKRRDLVLYCFDLRQTTVLGFFIPLLHYGFLSLIGLTVVAALQAVGVLLVIAMLITPGITALVLCKSFDAMLKLSLLTATFSSINGTLLSFYCDVSTGPCIVLIQSLLFLVALTLRRYIINRPHKLKYI